MSRLRIVVHPQRVARWLSWTVVALVAVGTAARIVMYQIAPHPDHPIARATRRLALGHEPSVANWYSSLALLASAILAWIVAVHENRAGRPYRFHWFALAILLALLALDEAVMIHELADRVTQEWLDTDGILYFAWVIPGAAFTLLVGIGFLGFLRHLESRTRRFVLSAGVIFISGALGVEMIEGVLMGTHGLASVPFTLAISLEEGLEMFGIVLLIYALLDYITRHIGEATFVVGSPSVKR